MTQFVVFEKNKKNLGKSVKIEAMIFDKARTNIVVTAMTRRAYILAKIEVSKLSEPLATLKDNYDHQGPTVYHDVVVIHKLSNNISTLVMGISVVEVDFAASSTAKAQAKMDDQVKSVEGSAKSPLRDTTWSTLAHSPIIVVIFQPQQSFSFLSTRDLALSAVD